MNNQPVNIRRQFGTAAARFEVAPVWDPAARRVLVLLTLTDARGTRMTGNISAVGCLNVCWMIVRVALSARWLQLRRLVTA